MKDDKGQMKTLLVTGARGTVGNYVVALAEAAGFRVIASDLSSAGVIVPVRGEVRPADLREAHALPALVRGCDAIIHTAAQMDASASAAELAQTNTEAVARLYEAAAEAGVTRFVHMSTATLYAPGQIGALREDAAVAPRGPYGMSKHGAEIFLRGRSDGPKWTILRAAPIYGRRGRHFAAGLLAVGPLLHLTWPWLPRLHGGPLNTMVHAEDVARALLFVLQRPDTEGETYNVSDGDVLSLGERLALTYQAYGLRSLSFGSATPKALRALSRVLQLGGVHQVSDFALWAAWRWVVARYRLKPALRPRLDAESLSLMHDDLIVDSAKLRSLGWRPRFPRFREGWLEILQWYQAEGWVPRYA